MARKTLKILLIILLVLIVFLGFELGLYLGRKDLVPEKFVLIKKETNKPAEVDFSLFWDVWKIVEDKFFDKEKIDYQNMTYGAISGILKSLGDPYTSYFNPEKAKEFEEGMEGKYQGIGIQIDYKNGKLKVVTPFEGTPAAKVGILAADEIFKINDTYASDLTIDEAVKMIRGQKGTEVTLLILREKWSEPKEFKITRDEIKIPSLKYELKKVDGETIAYLKIYQFNQNLSSEFKKTAMEILNSEATKMILDLRNNPGGFLEIAQEIGGWFLEKDQIITYQTDAKGGKKEYKSLGPSKFSKWKIVCLINKGTASAAEILASALRDNQGILLIGETSFGKGSVQEKVLLKDFSFLKMTIAKWLTPKGDLIENQGLKPDIEVKMPEDSEEEKDLQLEKALEIIKK